jgi:hypothetical protein
MIFEWFADFVLGLFSTLLDILPFPDALDIGSLDALWGIMGTFNGIAPVTEAMAAAGIVLGLTLVMTAFKLLQQLLSHFPWIGGAGA